MPGVRDIRLNKAFKRGVYRACSSISNIYGLHEYRAQRTQIRCVSKKCPVHYQDFKSDVVRVVDVASTHSAIIK